MSALWWYKLLFVTELILAEALVTFRFERRKYWWLRLPVALVVVYLAAIFYPLPAKLAYSGWYLSLMFLVIFGATFAGIMFVFRISVAGGLCQWGLRILRFEVNEISGSYQIRYDATWTVTVNGVAISTDTIHHNTSQTGASNRFADFLYEYVCVIALKQGVNVIEFTTTTKESLNFRSLALAATDAELELVEKPTEAAPEAVEVALPSKEYLF